MKYKGYDVVEKDNQIAILISGGYGSGWSSDQYESLAYDKRVVEFWLEHNKDREFVDKLDSWGDNETKEEVKKLFNEWGYGYVYFGGFSQIKLHWIDKDKPFIIREYDGSEYIEYQDAQNWINFKGE